MKSVTSWFKGLSSSNHRGAERRKSPLLVAHYWDGGVPMAHDIQNISSTGFYLVTTERWHPGTVVTMTDTRTDIPDANASSEGYITVHVRRSFLGAVGVEFQVDQKPESSGQAESRTRESARKRGPLPGFIEAAQVRPGPCNYLVYRREHHREPGDERHWARMQIRQCLEGTL